MYYLGVFHGDRKTLSYRIVCGCILLIAVVLPIVYTDVYVAQLAVPHFQPLVRSIEDVAANSNIKAYVTKGFAPENYLMVCRIVFTKYFIFETCIYQIYR